MPTDGWRHQPGGRGCRRANHIESAWWARSVREPSISVPAPAAIYPAQSTRAKPSLPPLLRELILAAIEVPLPSAPDPRDGRLMSPLLNEVAVLPLPPLKLAQPSDPDPLTICRTITISPDDASNLGEWATRLGIDAKTIQRRFARQTGMTFGQWRQQARLIMALEQLASGVKMVDVALNPG